MTCYIVAVCSSIPVCGSLEYHLEIDGMRRLWAKREKGKWLGSEPDGNKLLRGMSPPCSQLNMKTHMYQI